MTAFAISLLFGIAAFAALAVIRASIVAGAERARQIVAEQSAIERASCPRVSRLPRPDRPRSPVLLPRRAAA